MTRRAIFTALPLAILLLPCLVSAESFDRATQDFLAAHPKARFFEDGTPDRWYIVSGFSTAPVSGDPAVAAEAFARRHAVLLGLAHPASGLRLERVVPHRAHRFYQFEQIHDGLPVFGARVIVQLDGQRRVVRVSSTAVTSPPDDRAAIAEPAAVTAARQAIVGQVGAPVDVSLGYLPGPGGARLAYRVIAPGTGLHLWETYVDALTGAVALRFDRVLRHDANVFLENPVVDEETTTQVFLPNIEAGEHENHTFGSLARTATCTETDAYGYCVGWEHQAVADTNGFLDELPLLDDPTASPDGFAEVMAYYQLDKQNQWVRDEFGFDGMYGDMETSVEGTHIWAFTSLDWANAAYCGGWGDDPDSIIFGQGSFAVDVVDFAYDADVILHEFGHAISDEAFHVRWGQRDEMGYDASGGGVEEGNADYFAVTRMDNPVMSEYALGDYGRNLDNDHVCPDDIIGESHNDGIIVGGALWEIRTALGAAKTDHLEYGALASADVRCFADYAAALVAQAEAMQSEVGELQFTAEDVAVVEDVLAARGMVDCYRVVSLWEDGGPIEKIHYAGWDMTDGQGTPSAVQYLTPTFDDSAVLKLIVTPFADLTYDVLVRVGEPVQFTWTDGWPSSWEAEYDYKWTGPLTEATISNMSELELEPGEDYYFSILCRATANGCYNTVTMSLSDEPEEDPDAGSDADTDADTDSDVDAGPDAGTGKSGSGCGCRVGGSTSSVSLIDLLVSQL